MNKELVAVILAGGVGSRSWPITTSKILFPFFDKPLFFYAAITALPQEVKRVIVVTNPENDAVIRSMTLPFSFTTVVQKKALGMADALLKTEHLIAGTSLLVMNGDDIHDGNVAKNVVEKAKKTGAFGVIPGWGVSKYMPLGYLDLEEERIKGILEKPGEGNEPSRYINLVSHYINDTDVLLQSIKKKVSQNDDVYEKALTELMQEKYFIVEHYEGPFASFKYSWNVLDILEILWKDISSFRGNNVVIGNNVSITGNVYLGNNVRVFENTKIIGPCYIGDNTIIGNNNIVRSSHIGAQCVTGFNTDITRSYIGDNCWFHSNYIGDSVLEGNISLGGGTNTMNLRLDELEIKSVVKGQRVGTGRKKLGCIIGKNVRVGGNTSIMPGVKIGTNSFIGAGVVLDRDLPEKHFCVAKPNYEVLPNKHDSRVSDRSDFLQKIT